MTPTPPAPPAPVVDADLLLLGGIVVTMDPRRTVYAAGALAVRGGQIQAVGPRQEVAGHRRAPRTIDASRGCCRPG